MLSILFPSLRKFLKPWRLFVLSNSLEFYSDNSWGSKELGYHQVFHYCFPGSFKSELNVSGDRSDPVQVSEFTAEPIDFVYPESGGSSFLTQSGIFIFFIFTVEKTSESRGFRGLSKRERESATRYKVKRDSLIPTSTFFYSLIPYIYCKRSYSCRTQRHLMKSPLKAV